MGFGCGFGEISEVSVTVRMRSHLRYGGGAGGARAKVTLADAGGHPRERESASILSSGMLQSGKCRLRILVGDELLPASQQRRVVRFVRRIQGFGYLVTFVSQSVGLLLKPCLFTGKPRTFDRDINLSNS